MKTKYLTSVVPILIKLGSSWKISGDTRIKAIHLLKKMKLFESIAIDARIPIIEKHAKRNSKNQYLYVTKVVNGKTIKEHIIENLELYTIEMKEILDFDWDLDNICICKQHVNHVLSFEEMTILKDQKILIEV